MKAIVDSDLCTGCELCIDTAPEVFAMEGEKAVPRSAHIPAEKEGTAKEAAELCPSEAIKLE